MATTDDKLDKVFVHISYGRSWGHLEWVLDRFDSDNTKIILVTDVSVSLFTPGEGEIECLKSRCAERKFKVEVITILRKGFKGTVLELITEQGIKNFVFGELTEWCQREISELFDENPNLSFKVWFFDDDGKLIYERNCGLRQSKDIFGREYRGNVFQLLEIKQLKQKNHFLTKENEQLKLENGELKNNLEESFSKLQDEKEQKQDLLVALEIVTKARDKFQEERDNALKEAEDLRKERENIHNSSHHIVNSEFTLQELTQATQNFSDSLKLGEGGYGSVYKGTLRNMSVAIKKLNPNSMQGVSQFQQEVAILSQKRHPHLVTLIGSCSEESALVYEFLSNGSLEDRLVCANNSPPLTWQVRTRIIGEICLALIFLHSSKPHLVIHGDLNPHNILLDKNFISKLGDFGISRLVKQPDTNSTALYHTSHPAGTFAYSDPEYMLTGELTPKSDVYSFGIIILHLLTGTSALNIARRVDEALNSGRFHSMVDRSAGDWPFNQAKRLAEIGLSCAQTSRSSRPNLVTEVWSTIEPLMKAASLAADENHIPNHFICPILQDVMKDPHLAADGFTYEAEAIKQWLNSGHNTSPMTNLVLRNHDLIPNHVLRSAIQEWLEHNPQRP